MEEHSIVKDNKRNLLILTITQAINVFGDDFFNVAMMWTIYADTQSAFMSAIFGVVWHLTDAVISPIAGTVADRFNKKKIVIISNLCALFCSLAIALYIFLYHDFPAVLAIASLCLLNIFTAFVSPVRKTIIAKITPKDKLQNINSIFTTTVQVSSVLSSSISSFVLSLAGMLIAVLLNSLSYFLVIIGFLLINWKLLSNDEISANKGTTTFWQDFVEGFNYIKENRKLRLIAIMLVLVNIAGFIGTFYSALVYTNFGDHPELYGILSSFATLGSIFGGMFLIVKKTESRFLYPFSLMIMGIFAVVLGYSQNFIISIIAIILFYLMTGISGIIIDTYIMKYIKAEYMGRISGLLMTASVVCIPISTVIAGILGDLFSVQFIYLIAGIYLFIIGILAFKMVKGITDN